MTAQPFPAGAQVRRGACDGVFCLGRQADVVPARVGPSWRLALAMDLCPDCLADFAVGAPAMDGHVYALAADGLYHEVKSDVTMEMVP